MLHSRRRRLASLEERESKGETFWSENFDERIRTRIHHLLGLIEPSDGEVSETARKLILLEEGLFYLHSTGLYPSSDLLQYLLKGPDEMMPTVLEAWGIAVKEKEKSGASRYWDAFEKYESSLNSLLREHRVAYEYINGEMVPFSSRELHTEIVVPTLRLLASDAAWEPVETAYSNALREISAGEAADAITDAGTALQQTLALMGCEGNALGPLLKSARKKGLLGPHDSPLLEAIQRVGDWISAERNTNGDSHNASQVTPDDAWLIVHVVGSFILRISKSIPRHSSAA